MTHELLGIIMVQLLHSNWANIQALRSYLKQRWVAGLVLSEAGTRTDLRSTISAVLKISEHMLLVLGDLITRRSAEKDTSKGKIKPGAPQRSDPRGE
ncbi:hypothetical protein C2857_005385 [Epichloe festucae Fl1]|uniref:Uncharacterized protein n=1 Tax=Epichloe festucae (strain Fl1) TaxID=877507 RepID=A0A7S9PVW4_EPIFF|nr:hypothetical protein C2857_005385 [Epichloe festucae Fl1]